MFFVSCFSVCFLSKKKKKLVKKEKESLRSKKMLQTCEEQYSKCPSDEHFKQLENLQIEYDDIYEDLAKGAIIRSKATWYEKGERSNNYITS